MLPAEVRNVIDTYLRLVDDAVPHLVEGLYLHGSTALGEFRPGRSDIDFVALTPRRPSELEITSLASVHSQLSRIHPRPYFDGIYPTRADLAAGPDRCPDVPGILETKFQTSSRYALCPVTWHELAECDVTVRGPELTELELWTDREALLRCTRTNLQTYWRNWVRKLTWIDKLPWLASKAVDPWLVEWCVLGVVRLHALLATGRLHSKGGAGRYALETFDQRWHPILTEALRIREGDNGPSLYADPRERLRETREFVAMVVTSNGS